MSDWYQYLAIFILLVAVLMMGVTVYWLQTISGNHKTFLPTVMVSKDDVSEKKDKELSIQNAVKYKDGFYIVTIMKEIANVKTDRLLSMTEEIMNKSFSKPSEKKYEYATRTIQANVGKLITVRNPSDALKRKVTAGFAFRRLPIPAKLFLLDEATLIDLLSLALEMRLVVVDTDTYAKQIKATSNLISLRGWSLKTHSPFERRDLIHDIEFLISEALRFNGIGLNARQWPFVEEFINGDLEFINNKVKLENTLLYIKEVFTAISLTEGIGIPTAYVEINTTTMSIVEFIENHVNVEYD